MYPLLFAYAVYGFTFAFSAIAIQYTMVDEYHFSPAEISTTAGIISSPWMIKPLYGWVIDKFPLLGYKRGYVSFSAFLTGAIYAFMPSFAHDKASIVACLTAASLFTCVADVATDSLVVQLVKKGNNIQSYCWLCRCLGTLLATALSGLAFEHLGYEFVIRSTAIGPFMLSVLIWEYKEGVQTSGDVGVPALRAVWEMRRLLLFIFVMGLVPEVNSVLFFVLKRDIEPVAMSLVDICAALASSLVAAVFNHLSCSDVRSWTLSIWIGVFGNVMALLILMGAPALPYACVRAAFLGVGSMFYVLPVVIRVARACPDGAEGTTYSLVMAWMNMSNIFGEFIQSLFVTALGITEQEYKHILPFLLVAILCSFVPLCFRHVSRSRSSRNVGTLRV